MNHQGVLVFAEERNGAFHYVALELLGEGRKLADKLGVQLTALVIGSKVNEIAKTLFAQGADHVLIAEDPAFEHYTTEAFAAALSQTIQSKMPEIVLIGATTIGRDLAPRVSARLLTGLTADCTSLDIDLEKRQLLQTRPAFGGNVMATIICPERRPQMATVRPGVMDKPKPDFTRSGKLELIDVKLPKIRTSVVEVVKETKKKVALNDAKIIVSGGRGVGSLEGFNLIEKLANTLGGEVGASRAAVEVGYIPKDHQVGQTGQTVKPDLYIACGISGAIQHVAGMLNSRTIIAINKDPNANIFKVCDYGIVGDLKDVIPALLDELSRA